MLDVRRCSSSLRCPDRDGVLRSLAESLGSYPDRAPSSGILSTGCDRYEHNLLAPSVEVQTSHVSARVRQECALSPRVAIRRGLRGNVANRDLLVSSALHRPTCCSTDDTARLAPPRFAP